MLFSDLSLEIAAGESLCVWGPNGSGKSTLVKIISGLLSPTKGKITFLDGNRKLTPHQAKHLFGIASPDVISYDELTSLENLAFVQRMRGLPYNEAAAKSLLDGLGLTHYENKPVGAYSSGMKQRLRIATAVIHDPPALLLDEPGAYLDVDGVGRIEQLLKEKMPGRIVVVATNSPAEREWCAKVAELGR